MRNEIVGAVKALADPEYQWSAWIRRELPPGHYDEFTFRIHILYDDTQVLEDPYAFVGMYLRSRQEAEAIGELARAIDELFAELGTERSDEEYLRAPGWSTVVEAAKATLDLLESGGPRDSSGGFIERSI